MISSPAASSPWPPSPARRRPHLPRPRQCRYHLHESGGGIGRPGFCFGVGPFGRIFTPASSSHLRTVAGITSNFSANYNVVHPSTSKKVTGGSNLGRREGATVT